MTTFRLYTGVTLGRDVSVGDFVVIGLPPKGRKDGELATFIGDNAVIRSHTVIYAGNHIGRNFQSGHGALIREENQIGDDVSVGSGTVIEHHVLIKNRVRIHSKAFIPEFSVIEEDAWLGPNVVLTNAPYPLSKGVKETLKGPHLKKGAKVGANATILPGVVLGEGCLVGAGSVVTKDVAPEKVVAGNPARVINDIKNLPYR